MPKTQQRTKFDFCKQSGSMKRISNKEIGFFFFVIEGNEFDVNFNWHWLTIKMQFAQSHKRHDIFNLMKCHPMLRLLLNRITFFENLQEIFFRVMFCFFSLSQLPKYLASTSIYFYTKKYMHFFIYCNYKYVQRESFQLLIE